MAEPTAILHNILKVPAHIAALFVIACLIAIVAFYAGAPGFSLLDNAFVGALSFCALLGTFILSAQWITSRPNVPRVKKPFRKLSDEQRRFLLDTRATGKSWFRGYAESAAWFKELHQLGYIQLSRPFIIIADSPSDYEFTAHGWKVVTKAAAQEAALDRRANRSPKRSPASEASLRMFAKSLEKWWARQGLNL